MADDECPPHIATTAEKVGKLSAHIIIFVIAFFGNNFIIYVVWKSKHLQRNVNSLILNMAVSDLFIPVFVIPRRIVEIVLDVAKSRWLISGVAGEVTCKLFRFMSGLAGAVSTLTLVLMALERLVAVAFPLRAKMITYRLRVTMIMLTWVVGTAMYAPYFYTFKLLEIDSEVYCIASWEPAFEEPSTGKLYATFLCILGIIIPFTLLIGIYTIIVLILVRKRKILRDAVREGGIRDKMNKNVLKMAVTIVVVFAICWAPLNIFIFLLIFVWNWQYPGCALTGFDFTYEFLVYANTAINPCVYFIFVGMYRHSLYNAISGLFICTRIQEAIDRFNPIHRETFELRSIPCERAYTSQTKAGAVQVVSSRRLHARCENEGTTMEGLEH